MVEFEVLEVVEYTDGRVFVKYRTVADDGLPLVEGDTFTPGDDDDLEGAITEWLTAKRAHRTQLNKTPMVVGRPKPRVRRTSRRLSDTALERIKGSQL